MTRDITKVDASERQEIANKNNKKNDTRREQTANDNEIITDHKAFDLDFKCLDYQYKADELPSAAFIKEQIEKAYQFKDNENDASSTVADETPTLLLATGILSYLADNKERSTIVTNRDYTRISINHDYTTALGKGLSTCLVSSAHNTRMFVVDDYGRISSSGWHTQIYNSGYSPSIASSGHEATISVKGQYASVASSGARADILVEGDNLKQAVSGEETKLTVKGKKARMAVVGDDSQVTYAGEDGVIALLGVDAQFKGSEGTFVSAVVYDKESKPIDIITGRIGENGLKPDTLYTVSDGKFVEVEA